MNNKRTWGTLEEENERLSRHELITSFLPFFLLIALLIVYNIANGPKDRTVTFLYLITSGVISMGAMFLIRRISKKDYVQTSLDFGMKFSPELIEVLRVTAKRDPKNLSVKAWEMAVQAYKDGKIKEEFIVRTEERLEAHLFEPNPNGIPNIDTIAGH